MSSTPFEMAAADLSRLTKRQAAAFHLNQSLDGRTLTPTERERELQGLLPKDAPSTAISSTSLTPYSSRESSARRQPVTKMPEPQTRRKPIRDAAKRIVHLVLYTIIITVFGVLIRLRIAFHAVIDRFYALLYHHHRTPDLIRKDVAKLKKVPQHLSVILRLNQEEDKSTRVSKLLDDVAEITAWCASAGIPVLSIYEQTGSIPLILWN